VEAHDLKQLIDRKLAGRKRFACPLPPLRRGAMMRRVGLLRRPPRTRRGHGPSVRVEYGEDGVPGDVDGALVVPSMPSGATLDTPR